MKDISIRTKLYAVLALFLISLGAVWAMTYNASRQVGEYLNPSKVELMRQADSLRQAMEAIERAFGAAVQEEDIELLLECDQKAELVRSALTRLTALDSAHRAEYMNARDAFDIYFRSAKAAALILIRKDIYNREINTHAEIVKQTLPGLKKSVELIAQRNFEAFTNLLERSTTLTDSLVRENSIVFLTLLAASAIILPLILRTITVPLARLVIATKQITKGDLNAKAHAMAADEIGELAAAFNEMTEALRGKTEALRKTTEDLKVANAELREADRLKGDFLAAVSHELRTPLNSIINFSEMILEDWEQIPSDPAWSAEAADLLNRSIISSRRLLGMINDLLDLAKIEAGHMDLSLSKVSLSEVVADAVAMASSLAKKKSLTISQRNLEEIPDFLMDENKILQVFINLLSNAIKFTDSGGVTVEIMRSGDGRGAKARVIDTGIGITPEDQAIIFDRFRQAEGADSRKYSGTGLGLNLAKNLVELHGGRISVESQKGKGSIFTVVLPFEPSGKR